MIGRTLMSENLSIDDVPVPAEARHDPGYAVRVGQHVAHRHLVEPRIPEGDDGCTACAVASLVVVVVDEYHGIAIGHETPPLPPVSAREESKYL